MLNNLTAYSYCSKNENDRREVQVTYPRTFREWLTAKSATTLAFETFSDNPQDSQTWFVKNAVHEGCNDDEIALCQQVVKAISSLTC